jgi:hypothetical protein
MSVSAMDLIFGLPTHPLIVHASVVVVFTAALAVALAAGWPRFRSWAGSLPLFLSVLAVVLVQASMSSGWALEQRVGPSALTERHAHLAARLLLPVLVLLAAAAAQYVVHLKEQPPSTAGPLGAVVLERTGGPGHPGPVAMSAIDLIVMIAVIGTVIQVAEATHTGTEATWSHADTSVRIDGTDVGKLAPSPAPERRTGL